MSVVGIGDFMRPAGTLTVLAGVLAPVAVRRNPTVRLLVGTALGTLVLANFVFSIVYFWPANAGMFQEGLAPGVGRAREYIRRQEVIRGVDGIQVMDGSAHPDTVWALPFRSRALAPPFSARIGCRHPGQLSQAEPGCFGRTMLEAS